MNQHPSRKPTFDTVLRAERAALNQPVSLLSRIVGRSATVVADGQVGSRLRFTALRSADLRDSALCTEPELLSRAEHAFEHGYPVLLSGRFVPAAPGAAAFAGAETGLELRLTGIEPVQRAATLLCPTEEELCAARAAWRLVHSAPAGPDGEPPLLRHVLSEARVLLGLRPDGPPRYRLLQTAVVLQALSGGGLLTGNPRLSVMTLAQPGRGKRLLGQLAQLLSPVAMMGHGPTLTPAGLSAQLLRQRDGGFCVEPGMLIRGDGGVVIVEEYQALRRHRDRIEQALCQAAEDGRVQPCAAPGETSLGEPLRAEVGLYLDLNVDHLLHGVVAGRSSQTLLDHVSFATELLARIDVVGWIDPTPAERGKRLVLWADKDRPAASPVEEDLVKRRRDLQLLLCHGRDELPSIDLDPVVDLLCDGFAEQVDRLARIAGRGFDSAEFLRLGQRSLHKLAVAATRLSGRPQATPEDARLALTLFNLKVESLTWLCSTK